MLSYLPEGISSYAADIDFVMYFIYVITGIWFFLAEAILIWFLIRYRKKKGSKAAWVPANTLKVASWVLIPCAMVFICDMAIEIVADPVWKKVKIDMPTPDMTVKITGRQYMWLFQYPGPDGELNTVDDFRTSELHVPVNKVVRFQLEASDVLHSLFIPELRLKADAVPGRSIPGWFKATQTGDYPVICAELCGTGHGRMMSKLHVVTQQAFDAWKAKQNAS